MIPIRMHAILDYVFGVLLILAPFLLGFADGGPAQWVAVAVGLATLAASALTDYELSLARLIPFRVHQMLDVAMGILLLASPWLFGFSDLIRWPHVLFGLIYIIVPMLTARGHVSTGASTRRG